MLLLHKLSLQNLRYPLTKDVKYQHPRTTFVSYNNMVLFCRAKLSVRRKVISHSVDLKTSKTVKQNLLRLQKCTLSWGFWNNSIFGPFVSQEANERAVSVNWEQYKKWSFLVASSWRNGHRWFVSRSINIHVMLT